MDATTYDIEAQVEASHWWFAGRRRLFARLIEEERVTRSARTLDIGTSTGTNLRMLRDLGFSDRTGLDMSDEAIRWCRDKGLGNVEKGDVCRLPFADGSFDLVLATDIIEHVDDDLLAIQEIRRVLAPGGLAVISVPAFQSLWGLQDDVSQHKRRYRHSQLLQVLERAGLRRRRSFYFNYLLFAPIWLARQIIRLFKPQRLKSENQLNSPWINALLTWVFRFDVATAPHVRLPFGVSIVAICSQAPRQGERL